MINFEQQHTVFVVGSVEARDDKCDMRRGGREAEMATLSLAEYVQKGSTNRHHIAKLTQ